jgi:hypothetical protein
MGTRNLTCIYADGEYRVAQYGQWDGYPNVGGLGVLDALKSTTPEKLKERALACRELTEEESKQKWTECGADEDSSFVSMEVSEKMKETYPTLQRDMGWDIVNYLNKSEGEVPVIKNLDFASQSLFCEWCYVVDLDHNTFEVYEGFQKAPDPDGRFFDMEGNGEYYPVALKKTYQLDNLPGTEEFLEDLVEKEASRL